MQFPSIFRFRSVNQLLRPCARGLLGLAALAPTELRAQAFSITEPSVTTCTGALLDSGGEGASGYSNNEDYTCTICSDQAGQSITLNWITFSLNTDGAEPIDQLTIYDGPDVNAPLIGTYTGTNSPGIVSASFGNTSGCLTLHFTSNAEGEGIFAATILCYTPCEPPMAVVSMSEAAPALICQGEAVNFDASASFAAAGYNVIEYAWQFDDGSPVDSITGPIISHAFQEPGEYVVQIVLTDDNECNNTNLIDLPVWVSTDPQFNLPNDTSICLGATLDLDGAVTATTWTALPNSDLGGGVFLPDNVGETFTTQLDYTVFQPGATITNIDQFDALCVSMEHSFMGDIVIQLVCPNGQSVILHQQGGGGTFLGEPVDDDFQPTVQGVCYEYCWSPDATNGTWVDNAGGTLPPGTYESLNPMSALQGCPLNGTWTLNVTDLWGSDNGFICEWGMDFDPSLYPDLTEFTPDLGIESSDSAFWSGPGFVVDPNDHLQGIATPPTTGTFDYIFSVTDNFGCTYTDTMQVTVNPSPSEPPVIVGDQDLCAGETSTLSTTLPYDFYLWSNNTAGATTTVGGGSYTVTVGAGQCTFTSPPFVVTEHPDPQPQITGLLFNCGGIPVDLGLTEPYTSYLWSNGSTDPAITVGSGNWSVTVTNAFGCTGTDAVTVVSAEQPTASFLIAPPSPQQPGVTVLLTDNSQGNGSIINQWDWSFGNGIPGSNAQNPDVTFDEPGQYIIMLIVTTQEGCTDTISSMYIVAPGDVIIPNVFSPNGDGQNDALAFSNAQFFPNNYLQVFNRWGNKIYESGSYQNNWSPRDVSEGTYYYIFRMEDGREWAGHVTLLR